MVLAVQVPAVPELSFVESWRINSAKRFDLSGVMILSAELKSKFKIEGDFLLTDDHSPIIWIGIKKANEIELKPWVDLSKIRKERFDLESIDSVDGKVYVTNEMDGMTFEVDLPPHAATPQITILPPPVDLQKFDETYKIDAWFGIESMAVTKDFIFLGKEKPPLAFFQIPRHIDKTKKSEMKMIKRSNLGSQTDVKIRNGNFYILDREGRRIWKGKPPFDKETPVSFLQTLQKQEFDFYVTDTEGVDHPEWSTAEALELTKDFIYVGLDNNGLGLRKPGSTKETRAVLLCFKRPKYF